MSKYFYIRDIKQFKNSKTLSQKSLLSLAETKADSTVDAYESDWNDFCDWCRYHNEECFPASPETIVNYINDLSDYAKSSTIRRRVSAISENYNAAGLSERNPCRQWIVKEALVGLKRLKGTRQECKTPLYWDDLKAMMAFINPQKPRDLRDKAILLLGFMGAFRRSEITALNVEDLKKFPQGMVVTIIHSKTDQESGGQQVGIPYIREQSMCSIHAVDEWMKKGHIISGPVFRGILKNGSPSSRRLSDKSINLIVKKYAALIGLPSDRYGAHSLRHGFATYAALHNVEERLIMKQTRHRSVEMVRHYINEADLFTNNPISLMFDT